MPRHTSPLEPEEQAQLDGLQERLSISFRRFALLREAMTHASWNNERGELSAPGHDNERLEYLGDAVLELVVGEYLFRRFPAYDEGQLTQLRAALVNTVSLARLAERLGLGEALLLGRGAVKTGARQLPSLLANSFEALIGAIFLDQGYRVATRVFLQNIGDLADWTDENHKGRLQELGQERFSVPPHYRVTTVGGPGHQREYHATATLEGRPYGEGRGPTKQAAEQAAAHAALECLQAVGAEPKGTTSRAAGAARVAARGAAAEPARVRRRVTEVAADRGAGGRGGRDVRSAETPAASAGRRGILGTIRAAAEALVGRQRDPDPPAEPEPKKRSRRGRRGGRGRGGSRPSGPAPS
ncbi:MAG: ribonuclease III [Candidatus Dormibacteria bacterium]